MSKVDWVGWPFNQFQEVTCTDNNGFRHPMIKIPRFYYRRCKASNGSYSGNDAWFISPIPRNGYHIHPAFMYQNQVRDFVCIGKYNLRSNMQTRTGSTDFLLEGLASTTSSCSNLGKTLHLWTVYELFVIQLLFLIDKENPDYNNIYGTTNQWEIANASANWRGIYELTNNNIWVAGIKSDSSFGNNDLWMYDNQGNFTWVDTGIDYSSNYDNRWNIKPYYNKSGSEWNLEDTFISQSPGYDKTSYGPFGCDCWRSDCDGTSGLVLNGDGGDFNNTNHGLFDMGLYRELGGNNCCGRLASYIHD